MRAIAGTPAQKPFALLGSLAGFDFYVSTPTAEPDPMLMEEREDVPFYFAVRSGRPLSVYVCYMEFLCYACKANAIQEVCHEIRCPTKP